MTGPGFGSATRDETGGGSFVRLKTRADFLRTAKGSRFHTRAFSLQRASAAAECPARFGLTVTRKVGTAVERNRIRRRLREALRLGSALEAEAAHDYVIVARREILAEPFADLQADLKRAFDQIRRTRPRGGGRRPAGET